MFLSGGIGLEFKGNLRKKCLWDDLESIGEHIKNYKSKYMNIWWSLDGEKHTLTKNHHQKEKKLNERLLVDFFNQLNEKLNNLPKENSDIDPWLDDIKEGVKKASKGLIDTEFDELDVLFANGFQQSTIDFIREVRSIDKTMKREDIFQAMRNVWIINSIQMMTNTDIILSPSAFAYSMLYPYTDNYLDDKHISLEEKKDFNHRFRMVLKGEGQRPKNQREDQIFKLIGLIEKQYKREEFPMVYESLLAIHYAQERSTLDQGRYSSPYEVDILGISFEKGGASVLADGYLAKANLTDNEIEFMLAFGFVLQLCDDLQDAATDLKDGSMTIFSQCVGKWPLDRLTNKLFHLTELVVDSIDEVFNGPGIIELKNLIRINIQHLIIGAIFKNKKLFSRRYIKEIEKYFMLRTSFIKKLNRKYNKVINSLDIDTLVATIDKDQTNIGTNQQLHI